MNFELDELLERVDAWKEKLHVELLTMSPKQRLAYWKRQKQLFQARRPRAPRHRRRAKSA